MILLSPRPPIVSLVEYFSFLAVHPWAGECGAVVKQAHIIVRMDYAQQNEYYSLTNFPLPTLPLLHRF